MRLAVALRPTDRMPFRTRPSIRSNGALKKLWAPVPWMLELAVLLQLALGEYVEASAVGFLLVFNAALGFFQEGRAQATLEALKSRLAVTASARRDGVWKTLSATELVQGDVVKLSLGAVVPADVRLIDGSVLVDQSMLTGESVPIEAGAGFETYAGALIRRGEAVAEIIATGARTKFGRSAELVRTAHVESTEQKAVFRVVRNLAVFNGGVTILLIVYAVHLAMPFTQIAPLVLVAVLASIPVALPSMFTLAATVGARAVARRGVLPTRLSALDEAAGMDVLCADKTGTLTRNELAVTACRALAGFDEAQILAMAALASSDGGADPLDAAIRAAVSPRRIWRVGSLSPSRHSILRAKWRRPWRRTPRAVRCGSSRAPSRPSPRSPSRLPLRRRSSTNFRPMDSVFLPSRWDHPSRCGIAGVIALSDPPRDDSAALIAQLHGLGRTYGDGHGRCAGDGARRRQRGRNRRADLHEPCRCPTISAPNNSASSPAYCPRTSSRSFRHFSGAAMWSACAATAPMTRRLCGRRRWASPSSPRPMSLNRRRASC